MNNNSHDKEYRIPIHWFDRVFNDQLEAYDELSEEFKPINAEKGWQQFKENFGEEKEHLEYRWYEYKGKSVEKDKPAPLIIVLCEYFNTVWQYIADSEGLYIFASEYHRPSYFRPGTTKYGAREIEVDIYKQLIDRFCENNNVDLGRIYYFGLSYGDITAHTFVSKYKTLFAAAATMNGPMRGARLLQYPLPDDLDIPMLQLKADTDYTVDGFFDGLNFDAKGNKKWLKHTRARSVGMIRRLWMKCYHTNSLPKISTTGDSTYLIYEGGRAPYIYNEIVGRGHMPPVSYAQVAWDLLFNVYRRSPDGTVEIIGKSSLRPDDWAIGLAVGKDKAYVCNMVTDLECPSVMLMPAENTPFEHILYAEADVTYESFYSSIEILEKGFCINYDIEDMKNYSVWFGTGPHERIELDDKIIRFNYEGKRYEIYTNCSFVNVNGKFIDIKRPVLYVDGNLMIPIKEYAEMLGKRCSVNNDAAYITDHGMELGYSTALIMSEEILGGELETYYNVLAELAAHGEIIVETGTRIEEGHSVQVKIVPEEGYLLSTFIPMVRGLEVPYIRLSEGEYTVHNVFGDLELKAEFKKDWNY